jgi:hypothetical protein
MQHTLPSSLLCPPVEIQNQILSSTDIAVLFDADLKYVLANNVACRHLKRSAAELIGQCILDLYPEIIASPNHRYMLRALNGECISNVLIAGHNGDQFETTYMPFYQQTAIAGLLVNAHLFRAS